MALKETTIRITHASRCLNASEAALQLHECAYACTLQHSATVGRSILPKACVRVCRGTFGAARARATRNGRAHYKSVRQHVNKLLQP
eukprot:5350495-Alexandrium_andersonii.AAC.1